MSLIKQNNLQKINNAKFIILFLYYYYIKKPLGNVIFYINEYSTSYQLTSFHKYYKHFISSLRTENPGKAISVFNFIFSVYYYYPGICS